MVRITRCLVLSMKKKLKAQGLNHKDKGTEKRKKSHTGKAISSFYTTFKLDFPSMSLCINLVIFAHNWKDGILEQWNNGLDGRGYQNLGCRIKKVGSVMTPHECPIDRFLFFIL